MKNEPLHGIRVLAGPYCTMVLGELGADLINDELPCGDETNAWGPPWGTTCVSTATSKV